MNSPEKSDLKVRLIIAAMQGLCANCAYDVLRQDAAECLAVQAIEIADAVIKKLERAEAAKAS